MVAVVHSIQEEVSAESSSLIPVVLLLAAQGSKVKERPIKSLMLCPLGAAQDCKLARPTANCQSSGLL
jgi:hypothetical protein